MHIRTRTALALAVFCWWASPAAATPKLETVVVYGKRDNRPLYQVPGLSSSVEGDALTDPGFEHISQLLLQAPGVWVSRGSGQEHLTAIRSPVFTGAGACGAFWMGQDGIGLRADGFCNVNQLFDAHFEAAQSIQLLKGPNAALLGGNALFGAININLPQAQGVQDELRLSATEFGHRQLHGSGGWSAGDHAFALIGTLAEDDGYRQDTSYKQQKVTGKHQWHSDDLRIEQSVSATHLEQETGGYIEGLDAYRDRHQRRSNPSPEAYRDADSWRYFLRIGKQSGASEWSVTPYLRSDSMDFLMHFVPWQPVEENWQHSGGWHAQWQYNFPGGSELALGQELEFTYAGLSETQFAPAPFGQDRFPEGEHYDYRVHALGGALSAAGLVQWSEVVSMDWALRMDYDHFDYTNQLPTGSACAPGVEGCRFFRLASRTDEFSETSAQVGLIYQLNPSTYLFGKWSTGFRLPQASELYRAQSPDADLLEPERSQALEVGIRFVTGASLWQLAAYHMENRDGIFQDPQRRYLNGTDTRHSGIEYDVQWNLNEHLALQAAGQYARHVYTNQPLILDVDETAAIDGNTIDTAPRHMHQLRLVWQVAAGWQTEAQYVYQGEYYLDPENNFSYPGHELLNLSLTRESGPWQTTVSVQNALDKYFADRADVSFTTPRYFPGQERTVAVGVRYRFD